MSCAAQVAAARSVAQGECFGPPLPPMEKRHQVLSPLVRRMADERAAPPLAIARRAAMHRCEHGRAAPIPAVSQRYEAGAVFEQTYAVLACFCTARFLGHLLRERPELLEHSPFPSERKRRGREVYGVQPGTDPVHPCCPRSCCLEVVLPEVLLSQLSCTLARTDGWPSDVPNPTRDALGVPQT